MKTIKTNYFYGNEVSSYGKKCGYVDYATLAKSFDAVLCNDITKLFYSTINGEYSEPEQVNGYIDNSEQIEELQEQIEELEERITDNSTEEEDKQTTAQIEELQEQIDELQREEEEQREVFQYYIISGNGADTLQLWTDDPVWYIPALDVYVWGVTHYGTAWSYVLTDIKIEEGENDE